VERDTDVQKAEPGTHNGGARLSGYSFFAKVPKLALVFRKRALKPDPASATTSRGRRDLLRPERARHDDRRRQELRGRSRHRRAHAAGQLHGLKQTGAEDLVILLNYEQKVN
jgi:hypothetical protein